MKKGKLITSALALTLALGPVASVNASVPSPSEVSKSKHVHQEGGSPFDLAIANDERLIQMLKENGTISKNASAEQAQEKLNQFLQAKQESAASMKEEGELQDAEQTTKEKLQKEINKNSLTNGKGNKLGQAKKNAPDGVEEEAYNGEMRTDKVLVLLVDYPDKPHNTLTADETDMYYDGEDAYSREHYQDMLFGEGGWTGPDGNTYDSMKQYYEQQSGGSYSVEGEVAGWYTASQPAAAYGGNYPTEEDSDVNARGLVKEALEAASADPNVDISDYDQWDRYDLDGDGDYLEPDGLVDHLMVIHSGVGEEAGGGSLGSDAIWSHRWNLGDITPISNTEASVGYWGGSMAAYDYTIEPEDGAVGVMAHEFGHDLGLPDEYDTQYTGEGEPVSYWSIMSSGSWAGDIPGTMPTGFSPYMKEMLQASAVVDNEGTKGNWQTGTEVNLEDVNGQGIEFLLDEAATKGTNNDVVKVNLPQKETVITTPASGENAYFSGSGDDLNNSLTTTVDLTNATSAEFNFKTWYDIEKDWDYAYVTVNGETVKSDITTDANPYDANEGNGITGSSNGWIDASFDLSAYAGQEVEVAIEYVTDGAVSQPGLYADDLSVVVDGEEVVFDDAEGDAKFGLDGFTKSDGIKRSEHYYLLEWRSHNGVDEGLANIRRGDSLMTFDDGLVVWYVDKKYSDNWTGNHPGEGFVGVVDADQKTLKWSDKSVASTRYQVHDAAFSLDKSEKLYLDYKDLLGITLKDNYTKRNPLFSDSEDYSNPGLVDAGRNVPEYGLNFRVTGESKDGTVGKVMIFKK
ncbi:MULTISPECIES: immune inhibitor A domain-containing protein [Pontibacillus]|uniref:Immune inhibitor A n=1 Tax=Pontibacillus chungwhensis TaxID=265426 RepID=A0ABY8V141_9BACI|nr:MULTISPECIES: immune inhibitor A domain-containing protein [Pontibacillus]MCD5325875.1 immune inhibitor A [Pontibacillus sp. HN14]WIF97586.1 immune inhibitor A [Pontibacillus chungwhensis]